jgi:large conductance mechanosensitive channel
VLNEFKKFLMRGNVVDLAVAVVLGTAFGAVINSIVNGIITPILGLFGDQNFDNFTITLKENEATGEKVELLYGTVITAVIYFISVAAAIFFLVVKPLNVLAERRKRGEASPEDTPVPSDEALLLAEIRDLLQAQRSA